MDGPPAYPQKVGRMLLDPARLLERANDGMAFAFFDRKRPIGPTIRVIAGHAAVHAAGHLTGQPGKLQIRRPQYPVPAENNARFQAILQLPYIARPVIVQETIY